MCRLVLEVGGSIGGVELLTEALDEVADTAADGMGVVEDVPGPLGEAVAGRGFVRVCPAG